MLNRCSRLVLAFAVLTAGSGAVLADDPPRKPSPPALDDELLEFLGSVDPSSDTVQADDGSWIEYLSQTDIGKVAKPANPTGHRGETRHACTEAERAGSETK